MCPVKLPLLGVWQHLSNSKEGRGCAGGETKMFSSNYLYTTQLNYSVHTASPHNYSVKYLFF